MEVGQRVELARYIEQGASPPLKLKFNYFCSELKTKPMNINSIEFTPQNRERLWWTNIPYKPDPNFQKITLNSCLGPNRIANVTTMKCVTTKSNSLIQGTKKSMLYFLLSY